MPRFFNKITLIYLTLAVTNAIAIEVRPLVNGYGPSEASTITQEKSAKSEKLWDSDHQFLIGTEIQFTADFSPMRYGFGVGYKSTLEEDDARKAPAAIPVWVTLAYGNINTKKIFSPYIAGRVGWLPLISGSDNWWSKPLNFFIQGGLGVILPLRIGLEINYEYASVLKSNESEDLSYRISSGKLGAQISIGFEFLQDKTYSSRYMVLDEKETSVPEETLVETSEEDEEEDTAEKKAVPKYIVNEQEPSPDLEAAKAALDDAPTFVNLQEVQSSNSTASKKQKKPKATSTSAKKKATLKKKNSTKAKK
ncbi:MAG: hypothetical protein HUK21_03705 [Fibrobacteraceae bacterium]|nr:hypothetical protein [Fibrobacteraceae bacterium]